MENFCVEGLLGVGYQMKWLLVYFKREMEGGKEGGEWKRKRDVQKQRKKKKKQNQ